jgi:dynein heavy chain
LERYRESEVKKVSMEELEFLDKVLEAVFIFALIWSICCTCDYEGRTKFDKFIRD